MGKYDPSLMRLFFYFFSYSFSPVFAESALLRALWFVFRNLSGFSSGLLLFRLSLFSVCCFRIGSFLFPSLYARANIIMCVSFSSRVLRYKNMLCNTSVIQSITKKFQEIRIIFPSYVCWFSLKGLSLHPQSREMRHFRQCVTDLVKQT